MRAKVEEVFHEVADLSATERHQYFEKQGINTETRKEVAALLEFDSSSVVTLEQNIVQVAQQALLRAEPTALLCGPYRLASLIGSGGMGAVYLAERIDGEVAHRVAIKLLRPGLDSRERRSRFLAERQILANLSHANIARLLDAGHRDDGQPYLVMEYVEGQPIDTYTDGLSIRGKVRLFLKVCAAVSYLHRNLVVHRDLKPANILVSTEGEPKLLDFGIAKMLDLINDLDATNALILTPDYASPEQAVGRPASTATDVYSLGAVLYKLLTGASPHRFEEDSAEGIMSVISCGKILPPAKLLPALKGDLESILLKSLRREPQERYATIDQFAEDLEAYLESRAIRARNGDTWYRARKFFRRRWLTIGAATLAAAGLSGGMLVADRERAIAQERFMQVRQLASRFIELHDDVVQLPGSTKIREKMVRTALDYLDNLSRSAGNDSKLLSEIGQAYEKVAQAQGAPGQPNLGRTDDMLRSLKKAIEFEGRAAKIDPAHRTDLASFHSELAYVSLLNAHFPAARQNLTVADLLLRQLRKENPDDAELLILAARVATNRGDLASSEGNFAEELRFFEESSRLYHEYLRLKRSNDARVRDYRSTGLLASALAENKRYAEALQLLHEGAPVINALLAAEPENPNFLRQRMAAANYEGEIYDNDLGNCLGQPVEAIAAFRLYAEIAHKLVAADPNNASARLSLGIAYYRLSWPLGRIDPRQSLRVAKDSLAIFDEGVKRTPRDRLLRSRRTRALRHLAYAYQRTDNLAAAKATIKQAIAAQEQLVAESPADRHEREELETSRRVLKSL